MRARYVECLKSAICKVEFVKKDGTLREMFCTLKEDVIEFSSDRPLKRITPEPTEGNISVWDIDKNGWRSFNPEKVIQFLVGIESSKHGQTFWTYVTV